MNTTPITPTVSAGFVVSSTEQLAKAFEAWETDLRRDPASFLTAEEVAAMAVGTVSQQRAIYFMGLLREVAA